MAVESDGGLYAELVRKSSFAEAATLDAWSAVRTGAARVNLFFDASVRARKTGADGENSSKIL